MAFVHILLLLQDVLDSLETILSSNSQFTWVWSQPAYFKLDFHSVHLAPSNHIPDQPNSMFSRAILVSTLVK